VTAAGLKQFDPGMADVNRAISSIRTSALAFSGGPTRRHRQAQDALATTIVDQPHARIRWRHRGGLAYVAQQVEKALLDFDEAWC